MIGEVSQTSRERDSLFRGMKLPSVFSVLSLHRLIDLPSFVLCYYQVLHNGVSVLFCNPSWWRCGPESATGLLEPSQDTELG